ncbi:MAG: hypothetical protein EA412_01060 [Chitinophagaceae bacterium]|nr:MAG: hypothetical protein EA412_01060 [Chitinophagaceae bacterium]
MSVAGQVIISGAIGGTAEALGGGKFANGAVTGAYVMMFNHLMNETTKSSGDTPNYSELQFYEESFQGSRIRLPGVGSAGGFFYILSGKVFQSDDGSWYVYASTSAFAPASEKMATSITYLTSITIFENGNELYRGNLQIWPDSGPRYSSGKNNHTNIGWGYMPLPSSGNNIGVEIKIYYRTYKWLHGNAYPRTPFIYRIDF